jgi:hypothetical protein
VNQTTPRTNPAAHVTVAVYCRSCQHSVPLDLVGMAEIGHADTPLRLPIRCYACGEIAHVQPINVLAWVVILGFLALPQTYHTQAGLGLKCRRLSLTNCPEMAAGRNDKPSSGGCTEKRAVEGDRGLIPAA